MESCIGWIGGKRLLRKAILERFPTDEVGRYIEVFGGAGWVLFAKEKKYAKKLLQNIHSRNFLPIEFLFCNSFDFYCFTTVTVIFITPAV